MTVQGPVKEQQPDGMSHRGGGGGQEWVDGFQGKRYVPLIFFTPHIFPRVGQSVSGSVPLELNPPPPCGGRSSAAEARQRGCLPFSF